jgi:hypothetical protein
MVELSVRLVLSGVLVFMAGATGVPSFATAVQLAIFQAIVGFLTSRISKRDLRTPAVAALIAATDAITIAFALASGGSTVLETYAMASLAPIIYAAARHRANPFLMAPISAAGIVIAEMANHSWKLPNTNLLGLALTFLVIGCLVKPLGKVQGVPESELESHFYDDDDFLETDPKRIEAETQLLELRETYRTLRDEYRNLDRKSKKYKVAGMEACGADGILLYITSQSGEHFVVRGAAGNVNEMQVTEAMQVQSNQSIAIIRDRADQFSNQLDPSRPSSNIVLQSDGKVIGLLTVVGKGRDNLFESLEALEPCADFIANVVLHEQHTESVERRLNETEVLYAVVANADGANSKVEISSRVARDFQNILQLEHIGINLIENDQAQMLASEGRELRILDAMSFRNGNGVSGWLSQGGNEISLIDARAGDTLSSELVIKERIGSIAIIPIGARGNPIGFISAASGRVAGIDTTDIETLRAAAVELGRLFEKPEPVASSEDGILSPRKFVEAVATAEGVMVSLIPLQMKEMESRFGKPAMRHALRAMTLRIRPYVPAGAYICRHPDGMFLVYLPGFDRDRATAWANEVIQLNPGAGIRTPDGSARIPLQLRVKVAALSPQFNQFLVGA